FTERRRAEDALQEQRAILQSIIDHIPYAVVWKDRNSVYLGCNKNAVQNLGLTAPEELIGKTDYDMSVTKEQADFFVQSDRAVMETAQPLLNVEEAQLRPGGAQAVLLTSKVPLRDDSGRVIGLVGISTDITDRKR